MTPEDLNRTIDFIIQSQARLVAAQEQDRLDRLRFEEWSKHLDEKVIALIEIQSGRLDQYEKDQRETRDWQRETRDWQRETRDWQVEALARLDRILEKLTDGT